ncbi:hypothetical protein C2G38_2081233 [Gigaspora rosea]|uniref:Uncharacterized protein n=1 Tax=Gigaspora rosea TaxID=44941 RepID=A0A397VEQ7_9GLOM|nr:hypothetical protein C2G38_2081233 [Gigaspora rosea]
MAIRPRPNSTNDKVYIPNPVQACGVCVCTTVEIAAAPNAETEIPPTSCINR